MLELSKQFVNKAKKLVDGANNELAYELCKEAIPVVQTMYALAKGEEKPYRVYAEKTKNGAVLVAEGKDVMFREFGAGVTTATDKVSPNAEGLPEVRPGSFSEKNRQQFSQKGRWYYKNVRYTGIQPMLGMYNASIHIKSAIYRKAKDIMK